MPLGGGWGGWGEWRSSYPDRFFVQRGVSREATGRKAWIRQHDMTLPRRQRREGEHASLRPRTLKQRQERAVIECERLRTRRVFRQPASAGGRVGPSTAQANPSCMAGSVQGLCALRNSALLVVR